MKADLHIHTNYLSGTQPPSTETQSLFAADHQLRIDSEQDALDAMVASGAGLIFGLDDVNPSFFDLRNGLAGAVFQKFINYRYRVAFILPKDHEFGPRVTELAREYAHHSNVRITASRRTAEAWLRNIKE